jgi:hypothetical protein
MTENKVASAVSLAKSVLMGLDPAKIDTTLPTMMVELLCKTIIDLGQRDNPTAHAVQSAHAAFVQQKITGNERR